jgi:hypothetical protein
VTGLRLGLVEEIVEQLETDINPDVILDVILDYLEANAKDWADHRIWACYESERAGEPTHDLCPTDDQARGLIAVLRDPVTVEPERPEMRADGFLTE